MTTRFEALRAAMIDSQLRPNGVNDPRVLAAFASVPREVFAPPALKPFAYLDEDLEIAPGRHLMEPLVFGNLVMRMELDPQDRVLVIGAGTGYEAAVIARLAAEVVAVEEDPALAAGARDALAEVRVAGVSVHVGALADGAPGAPFDVLFLNGAAEQVPAALIGQLAEEGRFGAVLIDDMGLGRAVSGRKAAGRLGTNAFLDAAVGRLPGFERPRGFRF